MLSRNLFSVLPRIRKCLVVLGVLFSGCLMAQEASEKIKAKSEAFDLPTNKWIKISEVPDDHLGREIVPGRGAYLCYVPTKNQFIRYGGYTPTESNAIWTFDLAKRLWANPMLDDYSFPAPVDRPGAGPWWSMAWDSKRNLVWLNGGSGVGVHTNKSLFNSVWNYDPNTGKFQKVEDKNHPSYGAPIVYDSKNDILVRAPAYDGEWAAMHNRDGTWVFDLNKNLWERRETKGSPKSSMANVWVFDPSSGKCVYLQNSNDGKAVTWTYDAATNVWEKLEIESTPPGRVCAGAVYDSINKVILVYGGVGKNADYGYMYRGGGVQLDDTWALDATKKQWSKLDVGAPVNPILNGQKAQKRFEPFNAAAYDEKLGAFIVSSPTAGVWALQYQSEGVKQLAPVKLAALPALPEPKISDKPIYKMAEPNAKLLNIEAGKWLLLAGGEKGGGEVPATYDEATGYILKYGGCNNHGTTFASGYGNDLWAYDPATERWIALRYTDPCGAARPTNGCTRYYAYDFESKVTWFSGGTAGNYLCSIVPEGWSGNGIWKYDGIKDRFDLMPIANEGKTGAGVVTCFDRSNKLFLTGPKAYCDSVYSYSSDKKTWAIVTPATYTDQYTYGTYVDSQKYLFFVSKTKNDWGTYALDGAKNSCQKIKTDGDLPEYMTEGRPICVYDPDSDVVLLVGGANKEAKREQESWVYRIKGNKWEKLPVAAPNIEERMVYDRRHKVFIGFAQKGPYAFRLAK